MDIRLNVPSKGAEYTIMPNLRGHMIKIFALSKTMVSNIEIFILCCYNRLLKVITINLKMHFQAGVSRYPLHHTQELLEYVI